MTNATTKESPLRARWAAIRQPWTAAVALLCFLLPLAPLILFNLRTGGTLNSIFGNLGRSYYGVDNSAYLANVTTRLEQIGTLLRGEHFWYLGETYANPWAVWLGIVLLALSMMGWALRKNIYSVRSRPTFLLPVALLVLMVAQSAFTVSDLFITHYTILLPLIPLGAGLAAAATWGDAGAIPLWSLRTGWTQRPAPAHFVLAVIALLSVLAWSATDAWTTLRYHRILAVSGGYGAHSDASTRLAAYLDEKGYTAPVALDWGIEAPVRFLTAGRVNPIEVFGYGRLDAPDIGFAERVGGWLGDNNTVYVGPSPEKAVFRGRVEALAELAAQEDRLWLQETWFFQRSGEMLFVIYRSIPKG